ncbi:kinase-like domain-containing protein [Chlamydoabsidia padenii]|nr:kinase-like domain-containing protein [Chlamydoabsidia padenii]
MQTITQKRPSHKPQHNSKMAATLQKSKSEPNCTSTNPTLRATSIHPKRKSTGNLRRQSSFSDGKFTNSSSRTHKDVWRSPGCYEVPDILGNAYLKPECPVALTLRPMDPAKQVTKRPWYPPSPHYQIPQLPPLARAENKFEAKMRKILPKVSVRTSDPRQRYSDFKEIGTGVNGAVVKATFRKQPNVQLAIKRCKLDPDREYRAAILRELRIMASGHSNLIKLREVTMCRDDIWMAMDLMRCSVFAILCQRGIPEGYTVHITCETLKALIYLHSKGLLHRDIKCENLLLGWDGQIKLADFGLAARVDRRNRDRLGTTKWMAPEVIREDYYNEKIDLWSLGITIIEMMDRVPPHYLIKDEEELFDIIATEPSPTFTYSHPSMYMRGLVAWLLDEESSTRPSAKDVLMEIDAHIKSDLLPCSTSQELARFTNQVLPPC